MSFPIALYRLIFERNPTGHGPPRVSPERVSADDRKAVAILDASPRIFVRAFSNLALWLLFTTNSH